jgi:tRNA nucleotidyltransferase (CCA-adding enzyme)
VARGHPIQSAEHALERLTTLPGGPELLAAARHRDDVSLVGGAVRDLLLGHWPRELDVSVERDAPGLATALAASVSPSERAYGHPVEPIVHGRFGTASIAWQYGRIDVAERRAKSYPAPGALPEVRPGSVEEDLARRDFTVNAIALPLAGADRGVLRHVDGALEDLAAGSLRVLHEASFIDDPTRVLRLARYAARLGFEIESQTRELALAAVARGALDSVSGTRIGAELWLAAREPDAPASLSRLDSLGVLAALGLPTPFDGELAREALALLPHDGRPDTLSMGIAFRGSGVDGAAADRLAFTSEQRKAVLEAAREPDALSAAVAAAASPGLAFALLDGRSLEAVALAGALAGDERAAELLREWLELQRHVRLEIDGHDLIAAGVPEGPEIAPRLVQALRSKREGAASGREQELRAALEGEARSAQT